MLVALGKACCAAKTELAVFNHALSRLIYSENIHKAYRSTLALATASFDDYFECTKRAIGYSGPNG
jgi:hypothetical protein